MNQPKITEESKIAFNLQKCELEYQYGDYVALWLLGDEHSAVKKINLFHVFSFGRRGGETSVRNITHLGRELSQANVTISLYKIPPYRKDLVAANQFSGNTIDHKVLCARSALWLQERGVRWVSSRWYPGGLSDVTAIEEKIAVECGYTRADKGLESLMSGWCLMVVPYERECSAAFDVDYNEELIGFHFVAVNELIYQREMEKAEREAAAEMDKHFSKRR